MNIIQQFARDIAVAWASDESSIMMLPITVRDKRNGCIIRFRLGTIY